MSLKVLLLYRENSNSDRAEKKQRTRGKRVGGAQQERGGSAGAL
jgi:hypothetical protein